MLTLLDCQISLEAEIHGDRHGEPVCNCIARSKIVRTKLNKPSVLARIFSQSSVVMATFHL